VDNFENNNDSKEEKKPKVNEEDMDIINKSKKFSTNFM
jgi:hypothetical protein